MLKYVGNSGLIAASILATFTRNASAIELRWQAPSECPSSATIAKDIARLAGAQEGRALVAHVTISRGSDARWRVVIELSGSAAGHRELTADNCSQLSRAAALIVALAANPEAALDLPTEEPTPTSVLAPSSNGAITSIENGKRPSLASQLKQDVGTTEGKTPNASPTDDAGGKRKQASENAALAEKQLSVWAFITAGYDKQSLPVGTEFGRLGMRVRRDRLGGEVGVDLTRQGKAAFSEGYGANFRTLGAQLLGSIEPFELPFHAALCIGPRIDILYVTGYGTDANSNTWVWRPSGVFAAEFAFDITNRFALGFDSEMLVFGRRPKFVIENVDPLLYQPATLSFRVGFEAAFRL